VRIILSFQRGTVSPAPHIKDDVSTDFIYITMSVLAIGISTGISTICYLDNATLVARRECIDFCNA
jgi:hypothetical protein